MKIRSGSAAAVVLLLYFSAAMLTGCSSATRDRWLRTFFDDPPVAEEPPADVAAASGPPCRARADSLAVVAIPSFYEHGPFAAGDCRACHDLNRTRSFRGGAADQAAASEGTGDQDRLHVPTDRLCAHCHSDLAAEALSLQNAVVHAPVAGGKCLFCHDPHRSEIRFLLKSVPPPAVCGLCHDPGLIAELPDHGTPARADCLRCHDPHATPGKALLREVKP